MERKAGETLTINGHEYCLESKLEAGAGSYGEVWAATDLENQQPVALKFIHAENQAQAGETAGQQWQKHLQREIDFLSQLTDEQTAHIVKLLNHGEASGQPVLVLERLQTNLNRWANDQPKPLLLRQVLDWAQQILAGLAIVHAHGFVYRDLKFSNVLVNDNGQRLKLADFGTVKAQRDDVSLFSYAGTPSMMAPEQRLPVRIEEGKPIYKVDHRADFYAFGLMLFRLLTNQPSIASQESIGEDLNKRGYEGILQNGSYRGGLNDIEKKLLQDAIWAGWGLDEATIGGPGQYKRLQPAQALYDLVLQLLAPRKEERPDSTETIRQVLDTASAIAPVPSSLSPANSPPTPPMSPNSSEAVTLPFEPPPLSVRPPISNPSAPLPRQRRWIYGLVALGVSALAVGVAQWWPPSGPSVNTTTPVNTAPPLIDEPPPMEPKQTDVQPPPLAPVAAPESVPTPVGTAATDAATQPVPAEAPLAASPAIAAPETPVSPITAPTLTPVPPVTPPSIAVVAPADQPTPPARPSVPPLAAAPEPVTPAKPSPVPPAVAAPEPVTPAKPSPVPPAVAAPEPVAVVETPAAEKPTKPTSSQPAPSAQDTFAPVTSPAKPWRKLVRDPLAVGGAAPELVAVPAGVLEFTNPAGRAERVDMPEFVLAAQPVTRADYAVFARHTGRSLPPTSGSAAESEASQPVTAITWYEAQAYAKWLSQQTGQRYRLPSESEWLYSQKRSLADGQDSAWKGLEWTDGCDFGDCRRDQQMAWARGKREARPADQGGRDISFRVVREGSGG